MNNFKPAITTVLQLLSIAVIGALIYSNTLTAEFQFDDKLNIVDNPAIRNLSNFWPPTASRWFGLLTFSLNFQLGGLNPVGYHLVNICIHICSAVSLYRLVLLTFQTPYFSARQNNVIPAGWLAFACALLFVAHPIQTQAVTYVVQRFASLATLLYLVSLNCYVWARLLAVNGSPGLKAVLLYFAAGLAALASLKTKEIAATLPLVVVLYELFFLPGFAALAITIKKRWRAVASLLGVALLSAVIIIGRYDLGSLFDGLRATNEISRHDYLITQIRVIVTYIRLLFMPVNQTIDHHYRVYTDLSDPAVAASLVLLALIICLAGYLFKVSQSRASLLRLVSFGIFWFFITLFVESGLIPIIDVMFEHRLYLPGIGVIMAVVAGGAGCWEHSARCHNRSATPAAIMLAAVVMVLSVATYQRNRVWSSELTLWSDAIAKKPLNPRAYNMVGNYYQANSGFAAAIPYFYRALEVDGSYAEARSNLGNAYIHTGRIDAGLNELMITARSNRFDAIDTGILYYNIGKGLYFKGKYAEALETLGKALFYTPNEAAVYVLQGEVYKRLNLPEKSAAAFNMAHTLDPGRF